MGKRILYCLIIFFYGVQLFAQKPTVKNMPEYDDKPFHFGYSLGFNVMDFSFDRNYPGSSNVYADQPSKTLGFQVGMVSNFRLGEYFDFRMLPSFNFGQRNIIFFENNSNQFWNKDTLKYLSTQQIESSMLDFPFLIKYKAKRINNYRPYFVAGTSLRYDIASKKEYDEKKNILLKPIDIYLEMGFGIDYYLPFFKLSTEIKLSLGFMNVLNKKLPGEEEKQKYVQSLNGLQSNIIMFLIHIE